MTQAADANPLRILFALPGLHRINRGAERAFESIAIELSKLGQHVTLIGSGKPIADRPYHFIHAGCVDRSWFVNFPRLPYLRTEYAYEELTFAPALWRGFNPATFDVTATCGFPYCNRVLRNRQGTPHVFITQNGDHMLSAPHRDYRGFACDGLVCTNPVIFERHKNRWPSSLIPNGVDVNIFQPAAMEPAHRAEFALPPGVPLVLMVSALIPSKRVLEGIAATAQLNDVALIVAGDGPEKSKIHAAGNQLLPGKFFMLNLPAHRMAALYRCADIFLHMSTDEPSANVYVEALASGLPIVAHDSPVTRWTLEQNAALVDTADRALVVEALRKSLRETSPQAATARRELAERRFAWPMIAQRYLDFFRQIKSSC